MRKKSGKLSKKQKEYLEWAGFTLKDKNARFVKRLCLDAATAALYSFISIVLIVVQQADLIVLGLNILCLFRAAINNTINASEVTIKRKQPDIEKNYEKNSHYHLKAAILITGFTFSVITWVSIWYEGTLPSTLIKVLASAAITLVLLNDWENILVCAYNASIDPAEI